MAQISPASTLTSSPPPISAILVFDIDGVIRDVGGSYRLALADTVEQFTQQYRPSPLDNDWEASRELIYRYFEAQGQSRQAHNLDYEAVVAFFQSCYRGADPIHWTGYICNEPLLIQPDYLAALTQAHVSWGFFSGATCGSARYVLENRLGLADPVLVAMEDAPGKPDPTGLFMAVRQLEVRDQILPLMPVIYAGDTVADLQTVQQAKLQQPERHWLGVGILPPHAQYSEDYAADYALNLKRVEAKVVLKNISQLNGELIQHLLSELPPLAG
jgi:HAD superfamily phosphatase